MLTERDLADIEYKLCRAENRRKWWKDGDSRDDCAIGRMLADALQLRDDVPGGERLNRKELLALINTNYRDCDQMESRGISESLFYNFLNGKPGKSRWTDRGKTALEIILTLNKKGDSIIDDGVADVVARVIRFFFREGESDGRRDYLPFFSQALRNIFVAATTPEGVAEIRALIPKGSSAHIIRTSGSERFLQVKKNGELTSSGRASLEALEQDVRMTYVYPDEKVVGRRSVHVSVDALKCRTSGLPARFRAIDPRAYTNGRWAGEYLSHVIRYTMHMTSNKGDSRRQLLISREPELGPSAHRPSPAELESFSTWCSTFVVDD